MADGIEDHCTWWPEKWRGVDISDCCKEHDQECSTHNFYKCLKVKVGRFHASYIALGGGAGCWIKYTSKMIKRLI